MIRAGLSSGTSTAGGSSGPGAAGTRGRRPPWRRSTRTRSRARMPPGRGRGLAGRLLHDQQRGPGVGEHEGDLVRGEPEVDRHHDRAQRVGGEHRLEELRAVGHHDRDPVPEARYRAAHGRRHGGDPLVQSGPR